MSIVNLEEWRLEFPAITDVDMAFAGYPQDWFHNTLKVYDEKADKKWGEMASTLFFSGGKVEVNEALPDEYRTNGLRMLHAVLSSFRPKHEHKEAVAGLILKSICEKRKVQNETSQL